MTVPFSTELLEVSVDVVAEPCFRKRALRLRSGHAYNVRDVDGPLHRAAPFETVMVTVFLAELAAIRGLTHDLALGVFVAVATRGDAYREARLLKMLLALAWSYPTTLGTSISSGPVEIQYFTVVPLSASLPAAGSCLLTVSASASGDFVAGILRRVSSVFNGLFRLFGRHAAQVGDAALFYAL